MERVDGGWRNEDAVVQQLERLVYIIFSFSSEYFIRFDISFPFDILYVYIDYYKYASVNFIPEKKHVIS